MSAKHRPFCNKLNARFIDIFFISALALINKQNIFASITPQSHGAVVVFTQPLAHTHTHTLTHAHACDTAFYFYKIYILPTAGSMYSVHCVHANEHNSYWIQNIHTQNCSDNSSGIFRVIRFSIVESKAKCSFTLKVICLCHRLDTNRQTTTRLTRTQTQTHSQLRRTEFTCSESNRMGWAIEMNKRTRKKITIYINWRLQLHTTELTIEMRCSMTNRN